MVRLNYKFNVFYCWWELIALRRYNQTHNLAYANYHPQSKILKTTRFCKEFSFTIQVLVQLASKQQIILQLWHKQNLFKSYGAWNLDTSDHNYLRECIIRNSSKKVTRMKRKIWEIMIYYLSYDLMLHSPLSRSSFHLLIILFLVIYKETFRVQFECPGGLLYTSSTSKFTLHRQPHPLPLSSNFSHTILNIPRSNVSFKRSFWSWWCPASRCPLSSPLKSSDFPKELVSISKIVVLFWPEQFRKYLSLQFCYCHHWRNLKWKDLIMLL